MYLSWSEIEDLLAKQIRDYYDLRTRYPLITVSRLSDPARKQMLEYIVKFTKKDHHSNDHPSDKQFVEVIVRYIWSVYDYLPPELQMNTLHEAFNELDLYLLKREYNKLISDGPAGSKRDFFFRQTRFWKKPEAKAETETEIKATPPASFTKSFRSFGPYHPGFPAKIVRLDDISDQVSLTRGSVDFFLRTDTLHIGLFPLTRGYNMNFRMTQTLDASRLTEGFLANDRHDGSYKTALKAAIRRIREEDIHIACFPELSVCDPALGYLRTACKKMQKEFLMLVGGSFHRMSPTGNYKNTVPIYLYFNGEEHTDVYSYSKLELFNLQVNQHSYPKLDPLFTNLKQGPDYFLMEDCEPDTSLLVISTKKFGDIGFAICKDFLSTDSALIYNYERLVDHLFIVSLDMGTRSHFRERAVTFAAEHSIAIFYNNARCFDPDDHGPTFYLIPQYRGGQQIMEVIPKRAPLLKYCLEARKIP